MFINNGFLSALLIALGGPKIMRQRTISPGFMRPPGTRAHRRWRQRRAASHHHG